ncbi:MAG: ECF transporter S component [Bacilli bacterium]
MRKNTRKEKIVMIATLSIFLAIEAIICFVPFLGSIQIGPVVATLAMIPVLIIGIVYGPLMGGILGLVAGTFSFIYWTFIDPANPSALLFTPWNGLSENPTNYWTLVICFVPRILTGVVAGYVNIGFNKFCKLSYINYAVAGILGSLTNTFLVLFGTYILWGKQYAALCGMDFSILLTTILVIVGTNGLFEAAVGGILSVSICTPLNKLKTSMN